MEDDPFNKALYSGQEGRDGGPQTQKPEHMSLKEWERLQLMRELRRRKEGPFEPGLSVLGGQGKERKKCRECGSWEIDWVWEDVFKTEVCNGCKEKYPEKYSLLTKTEAKDDYLLTDREFLPEIEFDSLISGFGGWKSFILTIRQPNSKIRTSFPTSPSRTRINPIGTT